jgi:hypothetical protein
MYPRIYPKLVPVVLIVNRKLGGSGYIPEHWGSRELLILGAQLDRRLSGMKRFACASGVIVVVALLASACGGATTSPRATRGARCFHGRAFVSCSSLNVVPNHPARPVKAPTAFWPSGRVTACGRDFFSRSRVNEVTRRFGMASCFRLAGSYKWIVVSTGIQDSGTAPPPGGAIVATANCGRHASCLNPNAAHRFSAFTVSRFPTPRGPMKLQTTFGNRLLLLAGACHLYVFDIRTLHWYEGFTRDINAILGGTGRARAVAAPHAVSGANALSAVAPRGGQGCK